MAEMKFKIQTPRLKFLDEAMHHLAERIRPNDMVELEQGQVISPFTTPNGRVLWEVKYVEQLDLDYTFIYVKQLGVMP